MDMIIMIGVIFTVICIFPSSIIAGDAILAAKPKTAAVFGGGPAGLTAAMELREAGFNIKLYEKEDEFGGKMRGFVDKRGYPREHSLRIYGAKYFALGDIFDRAGLGPPMAPQEDVARWRNLINIPGTSTGYSSDPTQIAMKMIELGFFPSEYQYLGFQVAAWKQVPASTVNALYNVRFEDFLDTGLGFEEWKGITGCVEGTVSPTVYCVPEHTPAFHAFVARLIGQVIAAKPEDSTPGVMYVLQLLFRKQLPLVTPQCTDYFQYFNGAYLATGPTSPTIIDPWKKYIKNIGVKLRPNNRLIQFHIDSETNTVTSALVKPKGGKKMKVNADVFVLALPVDDAEDVLPGITRGTYQSITWGASFQFYLPCLPPSFEIFRNISSYAQAWESEYELAFMLQSPNDGAWEGADFQLHRGIEYVMSAAFEDFFKPGRNGKSFLNNTRDDALSDMLQQINFPETVTCHKGRREFTYNHADLIRTAKAGLLLEDVPDSRYQRKRNGKYRTALIGPLKADGNRWILTAPLYLPTPAAKPVPVCTQYGNLALAGIYAATTLVNMPTMEHAAESGKFAAQHLVEKSAIDYTVPRMDKLLDLVGAKTVKEYCDMVEVGTIKGYC